MVFFYKCKSFSIFPFTHSLPVKCPNFGVFSGAYLLLFKLNKEIYRVNLRIQSKCRKGRTREKILIVALFTQWQNKWMYGHFHSIPQIFNKNLYWKIPQSTQRNTYNGFLFLVRSSSSTLPKIGLHLRQLISHESCKNFQESYSVKHL